MNNHDNMVFGNDSLHGLETPRIKPRHKKRQVIKAVTKDQTEKKAIKDSGF
jgi:hypothetical protein